MRGKQGRVLLTSAQLNGLCFRGSLYVDLLCCQRHHLPDLFRLQRRVQRLNLSRHPIQNRNILLVEILNSRVLRLRDITRKRLFSDELLNLLQFPVELLGEEVVRAEAVFGNVVALFRYLLSLHLVS